MEKNKKYDERAIGPLVLCTHCKEIPNDDVFHDVIDRLGQKAASICDSCFDIHTGRYVSWAELDNMMDEKHQEDEASE
tara:strand:- start:662 stop:895 length:234 start_codon:yes stop_codon:yes gene_type:complete